MSQKTSASRVALSIDAGFGMTKYAYRSEGAVRFAAFPSVALPTRVRPSLPTVGPIGTGKSVLVEVSGHTYMVGPDARYELAANEFGRDLTDQYYQSDTYHAVMRAALAFMGEPHIDVLVLGLPMDRFDTPAVVDSLSNHYQGQVDLGLGKRVTIERVIVHPQPFGGYLGLGRHLGAINEAIKNYPESGLEPLQSTEEILDLNVLIVDSGAYTLDWLMMGPSGPIRSASAAANNAGRHRVVRKLYDEVASELGRKPPVSFMFDIDEAERSGKPVRLDGRLFDFKQPRYQAIIEEAVKDSVQQMREHLGAKIDRVDLIAVVGGETSHVAKAIAHAHPNIPMFVAPSNGAIPSIYTNLAGFQEYAENVIAETQ